MRGWGVGLAEQGLGGPAPPPALTLSPLACALPRLVRAVGTVLLLICREYAVPALGVLCRVGGCVNRYACFVVLLALVSSFLAGFVCCLQSNVGFLCLSSHCPILVPFVLAF